METPIETYFHYTRSRVSQQDIIDYSPNDPGYPNYVRLWEGIRLTGGLPRGGDVDLDEVISLTGWGDAERARDPERFRCYRRFTTAVGLSLIHLYPDRHVVRPINYLARELLIDLDRSDREHLDLMRAVMSAFRGSLLKANAEAEYPFFTFGSMILAQVGEDWSAAEEFATMLIKDEAEARNNDAMNWIVEDHRFLLGLTNYDQRHTDWLSFAVDLKNPNAHADTQLVIETLLDPDEMWV